MALVEEKKEVYRNRPKDLNDMRSLFRACIGIGLRKGQPEIVVHSFFLLREEEKKVVYRNRPKNLEELLSLLHQVSVHYKEMFLSGQQLEVVVYSVEEKKESE